MATQFDAFGASVIQVNGTSFRVADSHNEDPNITPIRFRATGRIQQSATGTATVKPVFTFQTPEIVRALDLISVDGVAITTLAKVFWVKKTEVARSAGADAQTTDINEGVVVPTSLAWSGENAAWMLSLSVFAAFDGTNNPFVYGTGTVPAHAALDEAYIGGKLVVNTVAQVSWQSATLNFGLTVAQINATGQAFPGRAHVNVGAPSLDMSALDLPARSTFGLVGTRITACDLYLRKADLATGTNRIADASLAHVKLAMVAGMVHPLVTAGTTENDATQGYRILPDETAAAAWVVYTKNVAIP